MSDSADRLKAARQDAGFSSARAAADSLGVKYPTYAGHENGSREYGWDESVVYARRFKTDPRYLLSGERSDKQIDGSSTSHEGDVVSIHVRAGMGDGGLEIIETTGQGSLFNVAPEYIAGHWSFPDPVKAMWKTMSHTLAFPVLGDSMSPTLESGSYVFVDTGHKSGTPSDIYVIDYGQGLLVKRLKLVPGTSQVQIISDNDKYGVDVLEYDQVRIHGRVVAWFHWRG